MLVDITKQTTGGKSCAHTNLLDKVSPELRSYIEVNMIEMRSTGDASSRLGRNERLIDRIKRAGLEAFPPKAVGFVLLTDVNAGCIWTPQTRSDALVSTTRWSSTRAAANAKRGALRARKLD